MAWSVEFEAEARKALNKLDRPAQVEILEFLRDRIATKEDPRRFGKALRGSLKGLWRYRVRDYRIICRVENAKLVVLVLQVSHRRKTY